MPESKTWAEWGRQIAALHARGGRFRALDRVQIGQRARGLTIPVGWALLYAEDDPSLAIVCELGERKPAPTKGYGGVEEIDRPRRTALTRWNGFEAFGVEVDVVLDNTATGQSVEPAKEILEALAGRGRRATGGEPPKVVVDTAGVMAHDWTRSPETRWWLNNISWSTDDNDVERNDGGNDILATATLTLLQVVRDRGIEDRAFAATVAAQRRGAKRSHIAKAGETLITIARDRLGDYRRWDELAKLNNIRDPRSVRAGAVIKLP